VCACTCVLICSRGSRGGGKGFEGVAAAVTGPKLLAPGAAELSSAQQVRAQITDCPSDLSAVPT
jgi:hypothetical protein